MITHISDNLAQVIDLNAYRAQRHLPQDNPTPPAPAMALPRPHTEVAA